jgi:hypothetical protein
MEVKLLVTVIAVLSFMRVRLRFVVDVAAEIGRVGAGLLFRNAQPLAVSLRPAITCLGG